MSWVSASDQLEMVSAGEADANEVRDAGIGRCEALNPEVGFLVSTLYERAPGGVPMLLKDAGQEIAGTPHWAGLAALRDAGHRSTQTTALADRLGRAGFCFSLGVPFTSDTAQRSKSNASCVKRA